MHRCFLILITLTRYLFYLLFNEGLYVLPALLYFIFFNGPLGDQLSQKVLENRFSPSFRDKYTMGGHD